MCGNATKIVWPEGDVAETSKMIWAPNRGIAVNAGNAGKYEGLALKALPVKGADTREQMDIETERWWLMTLMK